MAKVPGKLTKSELEALIKAGDIETVCIVFADHYGRLVGKRMDGHFFLECPHTACCNYLLAVDMDMNPVPGFKFANWEKGFGDLVAMPDLNSLRVASWMNKTALVIADALNEHTKELISVAPRSVLKAQLDKFTSTGLTCMAASELEFYTYRQTYREANKSGYQNLEPVGWHVEDYQLLQMSREEPLLSALRRHLSASGIPVENSKGEAAVGQHELNIRFTDALSMADNHVIYKQCFKEVAEQQGCSITFMAKPVTGQAGSSCHIHMSLWRDGKNIFAGEESFANGKIKCSSEFRYFLGGWIKHTREMMLFYAPTINSFKRYVDESWAPTRLAWCHDNRTAGFRIVGSGASLRIECRIPGADANIYLAFAASIASGLDGIKNKIEPPEMFDGDIYAAAHLPRVPYTYAEAVDHLAKSTFAREALGDDVVDHYLHHFRAELKAFETVVTDWETKRYFERI